MLIIKNKKIKNNFTTAEHFFKQTPKRKKLTTYTNKQIKHKEYKTSFNTKNLLKAKEINVHNQTET